MDRINGIGMIAVNAIATLTTARHQQSVNVFSIPSILSIHAKSVVGTDG